MSLLRASSTVGVFTLLSRFLGFLRDILIARYLGAGWQSDAFFVAFKLPNFLRRLFAEGAFSAAFVPMFAGMLEAEGREKARIFAQEALAALFFILMLLVAVVEIAMPWLMYILAPGFVDNPEQFDLTVFFTRITFPYLLFISLVSLLGGILNSIDRFAAVAVTPALMNLSLIGSLLLLSYVVETPAHALTWGVMIAGIVQLCWMIWSCRHENILPRLQFPRLTPQVKKLLLLIAPVAVGAGAAQISLVIDVVLASLFPGAVSWLYYADRMSELPLGVVGVAVATALLPMLSRQLRAGEEAEALASQNRALELALLLSLPAMAGLVALSEPMIRVLFEYGRFTSGDTDAVVPALIAYACGLPAYVLVKVFAPGFFARQDTKTPVKVALIAMAVNIVLNLILMQFYQHIGLAMATAISAWCNGLMLLFILKKRGHFVPDEALKRRMPRIVAATFVMGALVWLLATKLAPWFAGEQLYKILALGISVGGGLLVYATLIVLLGALRRGELQEYMAKK